MKIRMAASLAVLGAGVLLGASARAQEPSTADRQAALRDLSSDDFATREQGLRELQVAMGQEVQMLLKADDPEARARVAALLEFNEGLSQWILSVMSKTAEARRAELAFGFQPDVLPLVAKLGARSPARRLEGVHALARRPEPIVADLLAPLLDDNDRGVYVAVMEAAWERPATPAMVEGLWERAVEAGFAVYNPGGQPQGPEISFRGDPLGPTFYDNAAYRRMQDADVACEVLVHLDTPLVATRLRTFLDHVVKVMAETSAQQNRTWMYRATSAPMKNVYKLLTAYRPNEAFGPLFQLATGPLHQPTFNGQVNKARYFWSNRTMPMAMLVMLTDQDPATYKLSQVSRPAGNWAFPSQGDEDAAIGKLRQWWALHPELAGTGEAATQPGK